MRHYLVLAAILTFRGILVGLYAPEASTLSAWLTGIICIIFALFARATALNEMRAEAA